MSPIDKLRCFFGLHEWEKFMGPQNVGGGRFAQRYVCKRCRKMKKVVG